MSPKVEKRKLKLGSFAIALVILLSLALIIMKLPINPLLQLVCIECNVPTVEETLSFKKPESKMLKALREKDYEQIDDLLQKNQNLSSEMIKDRKKDLINEANYYYSEGLFTETYPLHIASSIYPSKKVVDLLIKKGADINLIDHSGKTALHLSILFQQYDITRKLIEAGVNVNIQDNNGMSAIHYAVMRGDTKYVDLILNNDGNINDVVVSGHKKGYTPLLMTLIQSEKYVGGKNVSNIEYIHAIIDRGADLEMVKDTMFVESLYFHGEFSFEMLENGYKMKPKYYKNIARDAISNGYKEIVKRLLENGFDIHQSIEPDYYAVKYSPLTWALHKHHDRNNNQAMIEFLIANGADIYFKFSCEDCSSSAIEYVEKDKDFSKEKLIKLHEKYNK